MKHLEKESIDQLLSIIPEHPATRVMQISDGSEVLSSHLKELCLEQQYEYLLSTADENAYEIKKQEFSDIPLCNTKKINLKQRTYAPMAKLYDFLFVTATIPSEMQHEFTKKAHIHIKSAGNLILFLSKGDRKEYDDWYRYLEEQLFVAISTIDIFENYDVLVAKKMHGWGGK
ncbi:MAG: hypothetical protein K0U38_10605 [Epsilonproteobacteria bacterium]|nr:hypothetical protein [Campylobacterota bacterium]